MDDIRRLIDECTKSRKYHKAAGMLNKLVKLHEYIQKYEAQQPPLWGDILYPAKRRATDFIVNEIKLILEG